MYFSSFCSFSPAGMLTRERPPIRLLTAAVAPAFCREPDYTSWIPPMQLRRMSKPVRMGIAAARICLERADRFPDSIHVGTAYGMLADSELFLDKMIEQEEQLLTPTAFIQSTHNTVSGQIALAFGAHVHNMTFADRGHSFENALLDAALMLYDHPERHALAGAVDELTPNSCEILKRFGVYDEAIIAGEGAAFFHITGRRTRHTLARLTAFDVYTMDTGKEITAAFSEFLQKNDLKIHADDILYTGDTGAIAAQAAYRELQELFFRQNDTVSFKKYCGEYPTAAAFGLALAISELADNANRSCWMINHFAGCWSFWHLER